MRSCAEKVRIAHNRRGLSFASGPVRVSQFFKISYQLFLFFDSLFITMNSFFSLRLQLLLLFLLSLGAIPAFGENPSRWKSSEIESPIVDQATGMVFPLEFRGLSLVDRAEYSDGGGYSVRYVSKDRFSKCDIYLYDTGEKGKRITEQEGIDLAVGQIRETKATLEKMVEMGKFANVNFGDEAKLQKYGEGESPIQVVWTLFQFSTEQPDSSREKSDLPFESYIGVAALPNRLLKVRYSFGKTEETADKLRADERNRFQLLSHVPGDKPKEQHLPVLIADRLVFRQERQNLRAHNDLRKRGFFRVEKNLSACFLSIFGGGIGKKVFQQVG